MARWETDRYGTRYLQGWVDRDTLSKRAAALGHKLTVWSALVDAGPYRRELGRCERCGMVAGWGLVYRGKIAESIVQDGQELTPWRRLYRGKHRKAMPAMWGPALTQRCPCPGKRG